ncbi:Hypothetical predicted protein [Olea europaea subsp. europaea]|uniref:Uncharacterized protein n=1 Tax=Olea europaea subsp. europaea TaxID=158383 RepID=A0A8S0T8C5_OLEEU|nr:Hypothetical predicted protein [Olea europaea subsp. europaea]
MALQSGNVGAPEKMPGPGEALAVRGQWYQYQQHQQLDERDGFLMWLRGEFAAANAIIDSLCHHLRVVGEPGEYDAVMGCIQQRRCNWNPVLHMQQYFPVAEVIYALQQVGWRRQQRVAGFDGGVKMGNLKEYRRGVRGHRGGGEGQNSSVETNSKNYVKPNADRNEDVRENNNLDGGAERGKAEEKNGKEEKKDSFVKASGSTRGSTADSECETEGADEGSCIVRKESRSIQILNEKQNHNVTPKTFVSTESYDGKLVNVVDGLKLYEELFDDLEVSKLVNLVNDLRASGRRGQLQGQTFLISKKPARGHGREMIQLGVSITDAPSEDESASGISKDRKTEPIPALLEDVIHRLLTMQVVSVKPDSCIIDIFNEGDFSQPHIWPQLFSRPVCVLFLTECDMTFGKVITADHPGDFRGSLKLSVSPGSMLVMQGRSADFARHAMPSIGKQRMLVTMTKLLPKKTAPSDVQHVPSSVAAPPSHWVPPLSHSPNHIRHPVAPKHTVPVPTTGVLPAPTAHPQVPSQNGIQPLFVPVPVAPAMPFPAPVAVLPASSGWPVPLSRHPPPRLPLPGTGVFLPPPGSGNSVNQHISTPGTENITAESPSLLEKDNDPLKLNGNGTSPEADWKKPSEECNGNIDGTSQLRATTEEHQNVDCTKPAAPV